MLLTKALSSNPLCQAPIMVISLTKLPCMVRFTPNSVHNLAFHDFAAFNNVVDQGTPNNHFFDHTVNQGILGSTFYENPVDQANSQNIYYADAEGQPTCNNILTFDTEDGSAWH